MNYKKLIYWLLYLYNFHIENDSSSKGTVSARIEDWRTFLKNIIKKLRINIKSNF